MPVTARTLFGPKSRRIARVVIFKLCFLVLEEHADMIDSVGVQRHHLQWDLLLLKPVGGAGNEFHHLFVLFLVGKIKPLKVSLQI